MRARTTPGPVVVSAMWVIDSCLHSRHLDEHGYSIKSANEDSEKRIVQLSLAVGPAPAANVSNKGVLCCVTCRWTQ